MIKPNTLTTAPDFARAVGVTREAAERYIKQVKLMPVHTYKMGKGITPFYTPEDMQSAID